jgi:DNA repair protein RadD
MPVEDELLAEIETAVLEQGSLSKDDVLIGWELSDEDYIEVRRRLVARSRVVAGPQRTGGFRAKEHAERLPDEEGDSILREDWEERVVAKFTEWFQHKELEQLLGDLVYTVRQARVVRGESRRRGTKGELASALVVRHGIDLLADGDIRAAVSRATRVPAPEKWHPGKSGALQFVQRVDLPLVLAGLPTDEPPPAFEYLEGKLQLSSLEDFQHEVRRKFMLGIGTRGHRSIVTLPTGAGKTRVAVQGIKDWLYALYDPSATETKGNVVLWLAHTEELCEQACACFRQVWHGSDSVAPLLMMRFWGGHRQDKETAARALVSPSVFVSTPQRVVSLLKRQDSDSVDFARRLLDSLGLVIVDEAHRGAAPSYRRILEAVPQEVPVVGLTATPFRLDYLGEDPEAGTRELLEIFKGLTEPSDTLGTESPRPELQRRGILATPQFRTIETGVRVKMPDANAGEAPSDEQVENIDRSLAIRTDKPERRLRVLESIVPIAQDPANLILYFGPTVQDAEHMGFLLRERKIPAAVVSGMTREATRRRLVDRFKRAEIRVLCNCEVLTTGFDAPRVTHVVLARPTVSQVLYEQMIGRGLRGPRFGGTNVCVILDCADDMTGPTRPELGYKRFRKVWMKETGKTI